MKSFSRKDLIILIFLTIFWGLNWPIMKIGVENYPPLSFRVLGMFGGILVLLIYSHIKNLSLRIEKNQIAEVIKLAIPNMLFWHTFIILSIKLLTSGRAAILGYTMPIWALLSSSIIFRDKIKIYHIFGILLAMLGAFFLLSSEITSLIGRPLGTILALIAAAAWGLGTAMMKRTNLNISTVCLTFWMMVFTSIIMSLMVLTFEYKYIRLPTMIELLTILYNSILIFGFAHVAWFRLARILPPAASSLSIMFIPIIGTFSGSFILNEVHYWQDYISILLIIFAMSTVMSPIKK